MATPLINGIAHSWADISINIMNTPVYGVSALKYEDNQEIVDNYGAGNRPVSRGYGKIECSGSITLHSEELLALQKAAPNGRIQEIPPFDIVVCFTPADSVNMTTDILKNCQFKKNARDIKEGDTKLETETELIISHIIWNA
jgi:hypothetical protein